MTTIKENKRECSDCKAKKTYHYSYPHMTKPYNYTMYCENCNNNKKIAG